MLELLGCAKQYSRIPLSNGIKLWFNLTIGKIQLSNKILSKMAPITQHASVMNKATATFCCLFLQHIAFRFENKVFDVSMTNSVCGFNDEKPLLASIALNS